MTEDTTQQEITLKDVFDELVKINKRLDEQDAKFTVIDNQLEVIREGISHNASRFDRMDANIYSLRADISNLKADLRDLSEKRKNLSLA